MFLLISSENAVFDVIQAEDVTAYVVTNYPFYSLVVGQHLCQSPRGLLPEIHSEQDASFVLLYFLRDQLQLQIRKNFIAVQQSWTHSTDVRLLC